MPNSKIKKYQILKLSLFPYDIMIVHSLGIDFIEKKLKNFGLKLDNESRERLLSSGLGHTLKLPNRSILIYFPDEPNIGLLAHEIFHAVWMILTIMGVEPSQDSEEVYAYIIHWVLDNIR